MKGGEKVIRYDTVPLHATKTEEGFIRDKPVIGRTGILIYQNPDGSTRKEYRPPEEAFNQQSLDSLIGKPVTLGHHGMVTSTNPVRPIGSVLSAGHQDGDNITADVILYSLPTDARELSCGYTLDLDETPGTTPDGEHYDAVQRNIRYNHVAVVRRGRAGVARLNMDGDQEPIEDEKKESIMKIRLDNGLEYEAVPEVAAYIDQLRKDAADHKTKMDKLQAKYDASLDDNKKLKEDAAKAKDDAKKNFDAAVKVRVAILKKADEFGIEKADEMDDMDIKKAIIKSVRGDSVNLDDKSADYIDAAFDMVKDDAKRPVEKHDDGLANQRSKVNAPAEKHDDEDDDPETAMAKLRADEAQLYLKEVK